ncbi:MAG: META domain-containing protein [Pseudomonadota bacterium]
MRLLFALPLILSLDQCSNDETLSGYGAAGATWNLIEIDGQPFPAKVTIAFPEEGKIKGQGPCNSFFAAQLQPYPWFEATEIGATRRACVDLDHETAFLTALSEMTLVEINGNNLLLSTVDGREMVFRAAR